MTKFIIVNVLGMLIVGLLNGCALIMPLPGVEIDQTYPNRLDYQMVQTQREFGDEFCCALNGDTIRADKHYFFRH